MLNNKNNNIFDWVHVGVEWRLWGVCWCLQDVWHTHIYTTILTHAPFIAWKKSTLEYRPCLEWMHAHTHIMHDAHSHRPARTTQIPVWHFDIYMQIKPIKLMFSHNTAELKWRRVNFIPCLSFYRQLTHHHDEWHALNHANQISEFKLTYM